MLLTLSFVHPALVVSSQTPIAATSCVVIAVDAAVETRGLNKGLFDGVNALDLATMAIGKRLADMAVSGNPAPVFRLTTALQEIAVSDDVIAIVAQFFRTFDDVASATDRPLITSGKELADVVACSESVSLQAGKALADAATSADALNISSTKAVADAVAAGESMQSVFGQAASDTVAATATGVLFITNYPQDITYFAADYVGISRYF